MTFSCLSIILLVLLTTTVAAHRPVATYIINLDLQPSERYTELISNTSNGFNTTVWAFYNKYFANDKILTDVLYSISKKRGSEPTEMQAEIQAYSDLSRLPLQFVQSIQMLYELQTLMVPIVNFTKYPNQPKWKTRSFPKGLEALSRIPWRGPGCTGIIAMNHQDNSVYHARNLDFAPVPFMKNLVYNAVFTKAGKEVFRSQMIAGYTQVITGGVFSGSDGWAIERNTRYADHSGGNAEMIHNLYSGSTKRPLTGWTLRKALENIPTYDEAVAHLSTAPYVATEYTIISGIKKGTILSRNPDGLAYKQTLGDKNFDERDDYIIVTNFDFFWHDVREWFDPTGGEGLGKGLSRRKAAQKILNSTTFGDIGPDVLFQTLNHKDVLADTVFQAIINVEKGIWNISQPNLSGRQ